MRIAMLHWGYPPIIGGVETHLSQLGPKLVEMGHKVFLLAGHHPDRPGSYSDRGMRIRRLPIMDLNWLYRRGLAPLSSEIRREMINYLDWAKPDLVHAHNMHYFSLPHAKALEEETHARGIPLVLSAHNTWDDSEYISLLRGIKWDHIIAVSHFTKLQLTGYDIDPGNVTVIHHGIDGQAFFNAKPTEAYRKYPILRKKKVIFHPARIGLSKGSAVVIKAFRIIKERIPDALLVMAGTKNIIDWGEIQQREIAYLIQLLDMFDLRKDTIVDHYSLNFMPTMYAAANVCVYPSIFPEPFGIAMIESMAAAKPIVVTRSGGMPEVIKPRINGILVNPHDHLTLAKSVMYLLRNPEVGRKIGSRGREIFKRNFYLERMVHQTVSVYQKILEKFQQNLKKK